MNYGQVKHNLISLGFAEESDLTEYEDLGYLYDAVNRAVYEVSLLFPRLARYDFDIDEGETDLIRVDMADREGFLAFSDTPVMIERDGKETFKQFSDYDIEMDTILVINPEGNAGSYRVYYERKCTDVDENTPDTFELELPLKAHPLVPLLAAYYLWLDDDEPKATTYYNLYEHHHFQFIIQYRHLHERAFRVHAAVGLHAGGGFRLPQVGGMGRGNAPRGSEAESETGRCDARMGNCTACDDSGISAAEHRLYGQDGGEKHGLEG